MLGFVQTFSTLTDYQRYQEYVRGEHTIKSFMCRDDKYTLYLDLRMSDDRRGRLVCRVRDFSSHLVTFDVDIMVDTDVGIVHFYNPVYSSIMAPWHRTSGLDVLRCGLKQRRSNFPHFFSSVAAMRAFAMSRFFADARGSTMGFDSRHVANIQARMLAIAVRGGLGENLPLSLLQSIVDLLTSWAVPVSLEEAMSKSEAFARWSRNQTCLVHGG